MKEAEIIANMDREWRLQHLYTIVDERGQKVRFQMRPAQRRLHREMWYYNLVLKARQHGFTTFIDLLAFDMALFTDNFSVNIIADKLDNANTIFRTKVRDVYNSLPQEIQDSRPAKKNESGELILENGSAIRVTTSARSGTCQFLHISEYGKICCKYLDKAREIQTGSLPAVHPGGFVFIESTAEGSSGNFYDLCQNAEKSQLQGKRLNKQEFKFHFFAWWENPNYTLDTDDDVPDRLLAYFDELAGQHDIELTDGQMNWYVAQERLLGEDIFREHPSFPGEAFRVAQEGTFYKREFERIYREKRLCQVNYETYLPVYTFWDLGISDDTSIWFVQFIGKEVRVIDYYEQNGEGLAHYAGILGSKPYKYGGHFAPHDIAVRELGTGKSRLDMAREVGIKFEAVATNVDLLGGIEQCRRLLPQAYIDERKCEKGIKCLENYRKEWDEKHGCYKGKPLHDWCSHGADSFRTMAVAYFNKQIPLVDGNQLHQLPQSTSNEGWKL
jgi:hypothetical protein